MVVQSVEASADLHAVAGHLREAAFDLDGLPAVRHQRSLQGSEGAQAFPGGLALEDQPRLGVGAEARREMGVEALREPLGDPLAVGDLAHGDVLAELLERRVQERAEAGAVEFQVVVRGLAHPEGVLEPEVRRVGQVVLEGRGGDAAAEGRDLLRAGRGVEAQRGGDLPIGFRGGLEFLLEQVLDAHRELVVGALEQQARGAQAVALVVEAGHDDVEAAVGPVSVDGLAGASQAFQGIGRVGEVVFLGGQAELGAQFGRQEGVGVAGPGNQVIGEPEDDQVRHGVPRGFDPAREVHRLQGEALAEALLARERERQAHPLGRAERDAMLVSAKRAESFLEGVGDFLRELQAERIARLRRIDRKHEQLRGQIARGQSVEFGDLLQDCLQRQAEAFDLLPLEASASIALRRLREVQGEVERAAEVLRGLQLAERIEQGV